METKRRTLTWEPRSLAIAVLWALLLPGLVSGASTRRSTARLLNEFPEDFLFGTSTAAYQIEGGWDADGKGENIWDRLLHTNPNYTADGRNADIAADSYHKYKEDVAAVASLGADVYRFSISWARILPNGDLSIINKAGIDYYNNLINALLENGVTPMVTMYHLDLPQKLQDLGGWPNPFIADSFVDYAAVLFDHFGDRVKWWITFNQPDFIAMGYTSTSQAPALNTSGVGDYMAGYTLLMAHARAWRLYDEHYRATQNGKVGITLNIDWNEPVSSAAEDVAAAERSLQFSVGVWAHPILTEEGDYPAVVRERVDANSKAEGRLRSRLPYLTTEEACYIRGTADFLGMNHYTTFLTSAGETGSVPSKEHDTGSIVQQLTDFPLAGGSSWIRITPIGIRRTLNWVAEHYPGYPIFITENGCSDDGSTLDDKQRIAYLRCYMSELLKAINEDGINVIGYLVWSLIDNFEWEASYTSRFGLFHVDFNDPERPRTPKASSKVIKEIFAAKAIPYQYFAIDTSEKNSSCYVWPDGQQRRNVRSHMKTPTPQAERVAQQRGNQQRIRNRTLKGNSATSHTARPRANMS